MGACGALSEADPFLEAPPGLLEIWHFMLRRHCVILLRDHRLISAAVFRKLFTLATGEDNNLPRGLDSMMGGAVTGTLMYGILGKRVGFRQMIPY